jgi:hypothetical protein
MYQTATQCLHAPYCTRRLHIYIQPIHTSHRVQVALQTVVVRVARPCTDCSNTVACKLVCTSHAASAVYVAVTKPVSDKSLSS